MSVRRLLIRPGAIGDCILSLPALESLKADFTEVWAPANVVPLIRFADRVRAISSSGLDRFEFPDLRPAGLVEQLRGFDSIVSWYGANRPDFVESWRSLGLPARFHRALPPDGGREHAAAYFLRQAGGAGEAIPKIACGQAERESYVAIHPFSGSERKNWPLGKFRELAARMEAHVCWIAGPEETLEGAARIGDLHELGKWLARARIYIGNDSGITHLAAAVGTPVVALFGPTDPAVWGPRGEAVEAIRRQPIEDIAVAEVLAAAARNLAPSREAMRAD